MKNSKWILAILLILAPAVTSAQKTGWCAEVGSGAETGWWIHRLGTTDSAQPYNLSWTRTHLSFYVPIDLAFLHIGEPLTWGGGVSMGWLTDDEMLGPSHGQSQPEYIPIAKIAVQYTQLYAHLEYLIAQSQSGRFRFSPCLKLGSYLIQTTHPGRNNFGFRYCFSAGVTNELFFRKFNVFIRPQYREMTLYPHPRNPGEIHKTYSFGVDAGLRFYFGPQK